VDSGYTDAKPSPHLFLWLYFPIKKERQRAAYPTRCRHLSASYLLFRLIVVCYKREVDCMYKKDLTDVLIEQGYIEPFDAPYVLDGDSSSFQYILDGEKPQKEEKDRA
jgi:hypothetical protein